jgi:hypothetical protein
MTPDDLAREREAEVAQGIVRDQKLRGENDKIRAMLDAFVTAAGEKDPKTAIFLRERFKTEQIAVAAMQGGMEPGPDRRWVCAFLQISGVWCDMAASPAQRELAHHMCLDLLGVIVSARGIS